jgi:hypothetical protein
MPGVLRLFAQDIADLADSAPRRCLWRLKGIPLACG